MLKKIIRNALWISADQVLRLAVGFFVGAWVARYLQPEQYGLLSYAMAFVGLFASFSSLNDLNQLAVRDITLEPEAKNEILGTTFGLKLLGALVTSIVPVSLIFFLRPSDQLAQSIVIVLSLSTLFYSFGTIDCWFQHQVQAKYSVIARNVVFVIISLIRVVLIYFKAPLIAFTWVIAVELFLTSIALVVAYQVHGQEMSAWRMSFKRAKILLSDSWALLLSGLAIAIYLKIDQAMIGQMIGDNEVGFYSIAVRFSEMCCFLPTSIVNSSTSSIIAARNIDKEEFYRRLQKLFDAMIWMSYGLILVMSFAAHPIIELVYGQSYLPSANIVLIHIWSLVFVFLGFAKYTWIITEKQGSYALISTTSGAILNIALNLWLIPKYQGAGAAIATLISYGFADCITCFIYPPARKLGYMMIKSITLFSTFSSLYRR